MSSYPEYGNASKWDKQPQDDDASGSGGDGAAPQDAGGNGAGAEAPGSGGGAPGSIPAMETFEYRAIGSFGGPTSLGSSADPQPPAAPPTGRVSPPLTGRVDQPSPGPVGPPPTGPSSARRATPGPGQTSAEPLAHGAPSDYGITRPGGDAWGSSAPDASSRAATNTADGDGPEDDDIIDSEIDTLPSKLFVSAFLGGILAAIIFFGCAFVIPQHGPSALWPYFIFQTLPCFVFISALASLLLLPPWDLLVKQRRRDRADDRAGRPRRPRQAAKGMTAVLVIGIVLQAVVLGALGFQVRDVVMDQVSGPVTVEVAQCTKMELPHNSFTERAELEFADGTRITVGWGRHKDIGADLESLCSTHSSFTMEWWRRTGTIRHITVTP
ncbi:hypothetical protein [Actinomyces oricola]|uniref:hypothetical protein n=1 Tax=Actinomyces oricola TaxID=206043 RepID=UPI000FFE50AC|nr:hypothetical protein [Actinomyces oricola]